MLEVRDHLFEQFHHLSLLEVRLLEEVFQLYVESLNLGLRLARVFLDNAQRLETLHVQLLAGDVEFFKTFLAGGVAGEVIYRIGVRICGHGGRKLPCLFLTLAVLDFVTQRGQELVADGGERHHLLFAQLGEEDFATLAQDARQHADLTAFVGRYEVALHVVGRAHRLVLHEAVDETGQQGAVAEGHVGKARRGDGEVLGVTHDHLLHHLLAATHDVDRVGGLVGADAEEMLGLELAKQVHEFLGLDVVVLDEGLHAVLVFLGAHVLVGREVGHDVEAALLAEDLLEDGIRVTEGIGAVIVGHIHAVGGTKRTGELGEVVFAQIHHHQRPGLKRQDGTDERGADGTTTPYHQHLPVLDLARQLRTVVFNIPKKHRFASLGDVRAYKVVYV